MADDISNLILEHLRAVRAAQARHDEKFEEVFTRLGALERDLAGLRADFAALRVDFASMQNKLDRLDARTARIERRLELIDEARP